MKVMSRVFLCLSVALVISGCIGATEEVLSAPTITPAATFTPTPSATPLTPTATATASHTPTLQPTDTPTVEPTSIPTPQFGELREEEGAQQVFVGNDWINLPLLAIEGGFRFRETEKGEFLIDDEGITRFMLVADQENGGWTWEEIFSVTTQDLGLPESLEGAIQVSNQEEFLKVLEAEREYFSFERDDPDLLVAWFDDRDLDGDYAWVNVGDGYKSPYGGELVPVSLINVSIDRGNLYVAGIALRNSDDSTGFMHVMIGGEIDGEEIPAYISDGRRPPQQDYADGVLELLNYGSYLLTVSRQLSEEIVQNGRLSQGWEYYLEYLEENPRVNELMVEAIETKNLPHELEELFVPLAQIIQGRQP